MTTPYTIYLVNKSASSQTFWCFLQRPQELLAEERVFANSSAYLTVRNDDPGINTFTIPVQYVVGAGAGNIQVGSGVQIRSTITQNAELGQRWDADYAAPQEGPTLNLDSMKEPASVIAIRSNKFDQVGNEDQGWFGNMSFGIETPQGYIGMTWSPTPQQTRTLTPKLEFYVATGDFGSNTLAEWTDVSNNPASVTVPGDFLHNEATVTYNSDGSGSVSPGKPGLMMERGGKTSGTLKGGGGRHPWKKGEFTSLSFDWADPKNPGKGECSVRIGEATESFAPPKKDLKVGSKAGVIVNNTDKTIQYTLE